MFQRYNIFVLLFYTIFLISGCASNTSDDNLKLINVNILPDVARAAEQRGEYAVAASYYKKIFDKGTKDLQIIVSYSRNLRYSGAASYAVRILENVESEYKNSPIFLLEMGKAQLTNGLGEVSILTFLRAKKLDPDNWAVYSSLGIGYDLTKEYGKAQVSYGQALALSPGNSIVLNNMAISLALTGKLDEAIKILEDAPKIADGKAHIRQNLALFYGIKGDLVKSEYYAKLDLDNEMVKRNLSYFKRFQK